jgi:hypothetical protein
LGSISDAKNSREENNLAIGNGTMLRFDICNYITGDGTTDLSERFSQMVQCLSAFFAEQSNLRAGQILCFCGFFTRPFALVPLKLID